jgi:FdhD protein
MLDAHPRTTYTQAICRRFALLLGFEGMHMQQPYESYTLTQYLPDRYKKTRSDVIVENGVALSVNGNVWLTLMCTPTHLPALGVGFLYNEGIISNADELEDVHICDNQTIIDIWLNKSVEKPVDWRRTTGCTGGYTSVRPDHQSDLSAQAMIYTPDQINHLVQHLFESQDLYRKAGGVHASALSNGHDILLVSEDVGRHNTLDKIAGRMLLENIVPDDRILLTTGRVSSEMLQKAGSIGAPLLISRTSPTSASIEMAETFGITLVGYARSKRFSVYTHQHRIRL